PCRHPFIHSFNPAIAPPWQSKTDWDAWKAIAKEFSSLARTHLGTRTDLVAKPLWHDTPEAMANPRGEVKDWRAGECEPVPGQTKPVLRLLARRNCRRHGGPADGRPALDTDVQMAELIMALSGTTNGRLVTDGFKNLEKRVGLDYLHLLAGEHEGKRISFADIQAPP